VRIPLREHPVLALVAVAVIGLLAWGFWPKAVLVEAVKVASAPLTVTVEEEGRTRVIDRYVIAAPIDGVTCRVDLKVGDPVEPGQVLLLISPLESQVLDPRSRAQAQARISAAEAALRSAEEQAHAAEAAAQLAATELKRIRPLHAQGLVARDALDKAESAAKGAVATQRSADFRVGVARYELEVARSTLEYSAATPRDTPAEQVPVRSPIHGRILKVVRKCEGPVRTGDPLLEVGDPAALEVEVDVLSSDAVKIRPGMRVYFDRWGGAGSLEGVVRTVEPAGFTKISALGVEEQRVLVISDFTSPPEQWARLGDGYRVEARFVIWHGDQVLQVPAASLFRRGSEWAVFAIEGGRARLRTVTLGERTGLAAQIAKGLDEGTQVIVHPSDEVEDGRRVAVR